jgi:hypothetical protein
MADGEDGVEVKDVERIEIAPADGDDVVETEETEPESSQVETEGEPEPEEGEDKPDELVARKPVAVAKVEVKTDDLKEVTGETPRERALRLELTNLKRKQRQERGQEIFTEKPAHAPERKVSPEAQAILDKYKPEEIQSLREVMPALAEEMGFVRKDQLEVSNFATQAQSELDTFLEKHPEYSPDKDPDGTLWGAFRNEYQMYKQPSNPKDFKKIFERVHEKVFGIQASGSNNKINAAREKANAASHAGASTPASQRSNQRSKTQTSGLRTDMLKGFSPEEIAELEKGQGE